MINGVSSLLTDPNYIQELQIAQQGALSQVGQDNDYHAQQEAQRKDEASQS